MLLVATSSVFNSRLTCFQPDITGTNIYDAKKGEFTFKPGPLFCNLLLADEINRAPPKTQAALLEAYAREASDHRYGYAQVALHRSLLWPLKTLLSKKVPTRFLKHNLTVSCSRCPSATLTVLTRTKS
jgi:hypothetical protein